MTDVSQETADVNVIDAWRGGMAYDRLRWESDPWQGKLYRIGTQEWLDWRDERDIRVSDEQFARAAINRELRHEVARLRGIVREQQKED